MDLKRLSDNEIESAYNEDFAVTFSRKPTQDDIQLIMLKQVARKAEYEIIREVVRCLEDVNMSTNDLSIFEQKVLGILEELKRNIKE